MRLAGVDIGSNTSLLLAVEMAAGGGFRVLRDKIYFTRLAEGLGETGRISESALARLESAFASMRSALDSLKAEKVSVAATSASREAANKSRLFELGEKYGLSPLKIISPEKEAELTFAGSLFGLSPACHGHIGRAGSEPENLSNPLVVDIGGGSTELASSGKSWSLPLGSVSLSEKFLSPAGDLSRKGRAGMLAAAEAELEPLSAFLREDFGAIVFTAGTPVTLAFMEKKISDPNKAHGLALKKDCARLWLEKLSGMSFERRKAEPYLPAHRSDVIVAGLMILSRILEKSGRREFIVSAGGVRYGLILEMMPARPGSGASAAGAPLAPFF